MNILIIEDDLFLSQNIKKVFEKKILSNRIKIINSFDSFLNEICIINSYDIVLIDILLEKKSKKNGIDILEIIRRKNINIPLVIISSFDEIKRLERAFNSGANDYIIKPFRLRELEIRVFKWFTTYFCSFNLDNECRANYKGLSYSLFKNEFYYKNSKINLTKKNKYLLSIFLRNSEKILTERFLISKIWGDNDFLIPRNLRVSVLRLKSLLKQVGIDTWIINVRGEGYMFRNDN